MNKILLRMFALLLILSTAGNAQAQASWHYLPNNGLNNYGDARFEDVYFTDSLTGYAVSLGGRIFKTTDAGTNWTIKVDSQQSVYTRFRSIEFLDDKTTGLAGALISNQRNLYLTTDSGNTWTNIESSLQDTLTELGIVPTGKVICGIAHYGNTFYAVGAWYSKHARCYKSIDKGVTWETHYIDTALANELVDIVFTSADTGFAVGGRIPGHNSGMNGSQQSVVIRTTDGGNTWTQVFVDSLIGGRIWKIQAISKDVLVGSIEPYYSDTVAMIKSIDGGNTWSILGTGYMRPPLPYTYGTQGVGFVSPNHGFIGGYYSGLFETHDGGLSWDSLSFGENFNRFFVMDSTHIYAGGKQVYFYGNSIPNGITNAPAHTPTAEHKLYNITPNPARGTVKIDFDLATKTYVMLNVVNTDGRRGWPVMQCLLEKGHHTYEWNSISAPPGNYLIWLGTNEIPLVKKFTIIK